MIKANGLQSGVNGQRAYMMSLKGGTKTGLEKANWVLDRNYERSGIGIGAIERSLNTYSFPASSSPMSDAMKRYSYPGVGALLNGLGSTDSPEASGEVGWMNVLQSFVAPIGAGVGRLIRREAPPTTIVHQGAAAGGTPGWVWPVAIGGGAVALWMLIRRR
jgi:hypothetical protein